MNPNDLRSLLRSPDEISRDPFGILQAISILVNSEQNQHMGRDLLLRAMEWREVFNPYTEVLDSLSRLSGLFPYVEEEHLNFKDSIAYQYHRPDSTQEIVFHREQAEIYRRLIAGDSVILSAPTSFGKSKIIDAVIARGHLKNIVVVVPTLALIDETRRRFAAFSKAYKIIANPAQTPAAKNIFVLTAERVVAIKDLPKIEFFVIDEFYKIGAVEEDQARTVALNEAFYRLNRDNAQFYLLGPSIQKIPDGLEAQYRCFFYPTRYSTVAVDTIRVPGKGRNVERLLAILNDLNEPTLIYCNSPGTVNKVARAMLDADIVNPTSDLDGASDWIGNKYHPDWVLAEGLPKGIGIHHGRLPRSLAQFVVRAFNDEKLRFLICTSTLIEGVNTKAKNVAIWDNKIGNRPLDFFTFNNIRGRSGRMFQHFIGRVFLFSAPPEEMLPFVDFPLFTQDETAPESLLIQLDPQDLTKKSKDRVQKYSGQNLLSFDVIRSNHSMPPESQLELARKIEQDAVRASPLLAWIGFPNYSQLKFACELIWEFLVEGKRVNGVASGSQLAVKIMQLSQVASAAERVLEELKPGKWAAKSPDDAVERVLQFERSWAGFDFPRYLMALSNIQKDVLSRLSLPFGDYSAYAAQVESLFLPPVVAALDEYGLPFALGQKLLPLLGTNDDIDVALNSLRELDVDAFNLSEFEKELVVEAKNGL